MRFFGKPKVPERVAVAACISSVLREVNDNWPTIRKQLSSAPIAAPQLDDEWAPLEFALAVVGLQFQGLANLMPASQSERVKKLAFDFFDQSEIKGQAGPLLQAYDSAWNQDPTGGLASVLHTRLRCTSVVAFGENHYQSPLAIMALSQLLVQYGVIGWWKEFLRSYRLVSD